ncbi:secoisolariciresinol dehydrogenase-like [Vigna radiata var. radiata]|uniref:Secoisolariciresinol dehydrogenase-like n=1 Tax=Vigna radiata var. radiata TaxID=3916 RepID=A0A3Q0EQQ7_VIGRR|nr:secoisolariciresinol dehydrogenase-like [Vigna radiata var. radiata]
MSMMGELTYFLGLQIKQKEEGTFISQTKYCKEILKKFEMDKSKEASTPMGTSCYLDKDESGKEVKQTKYRGMIGSFLYLTASRPDILQSVCVCARYQFSPRESHLTAVKRILKYLKGTKSFGLWYPSGAEPSLIGFSDADYGDCSHVVSLTPTYRLEGKVALITGGARGIGECMARLFCKHEAKDVKNAVNMVVSKYGKLDIMVNNAATIDDAKPIILENDVAELERVARVNLIGPFLGTKHAARVMIPARKGSIISIGSVSSSVGGIATHTYTSSKHGIVGLTKNAATELGKFSIRVNCLSPYFNGNVSGIGFFKILN